MKKFIYLLMAIALVQCSTKNSSDYFSCNPPKDSIPPPVDTVVVNPEDTLPLITHGDELGPVELMTQPLQNFKAESVSTRELSPPAFQAVQSYPLTRSIYLDRAHLVYKNTTEANKFSAYCKQWNFTAVHMYHFYDMIGSSSNYPYVHAFCKLLRANGVTRIVAVNGSASTSAFERFWQSTSDTTKKPNGINLELEWWNGATPYSTWINTLTTLDSYCDSKNPDLQNSFYMGWYKLMGSYSDVQVASQQLQEADFIDLHIYQDGKVSATYGQSRWDAIAKAAQARGRIAVVNPIISAEETDWGFSSDFQGYYLQSLGFAGIEKKFIDDWNLKASTVAKQWIKLGEFKYFMKRCVWVAIPPTQ